MLVFAIVRVGANVLSLPTTASLSLAVRGRTETLIWDVRQGMEEAATGNATAGVIHHALHTWGSDLEHVGSRASNRPEKQR
ncbi:hypothetical protein A6V37_00870 [Paraburkholderia ginsengiterrae]|uniref:Uncharacterized protein n=1 Tax=Paraburkholderia ginsengiterrae TaxID=1462993 RepID=A0A1A9ND93_9BURK|nr:hypothetical protein A6V37_00870 [Paraburkholderia ginsengiterrae]